MDVLTTLIPLLITCGIFVLIFLLLCKGVSKHVKKKNAVGVSIYIVISILIFWPLAVGEIIYVLLKWNKEPERTEPTAHQDPNLETAPAKKAQVEDDYTRWKAERIKDAENDN